MINLSPLELERLKLLLSGKALPTEAQISILDILRSRFPDFLTALPDITKENLKDNNFLIKYFANPYNRNKIKNALRSELSLSSAQEIDLEQALNEKPIAAEEVGGQPTNQAATPATGQEIQPTGTTTGGAPFGGIGLPTVPSIPYSPRIVRKIPQAQAEGQTSRFSAFRSSVKNFASPLGPSIKRGLGGMGRGITGAGRAGLGAATPALGRMGNGLLNGIQRISQPGGIGGGGLGKGLSKSSNRLAIGLVGGLIFFVLIAGVIGGMGGTTPTGEAAPVSNNSGLDYNLPLRDTSIVVTDIRSAILKQWPNAKIDNWQIIIDQAKLQGWNPAVLLTLWIEESGAQGAASYTDALGCDVGKPTQDIQISLKCFFDSFNIKFTNDQFAQFMLTYSAPNDPFPFKSNPNFPKNFKDWYSKLVPTGAGAIVAITPTPATGPSTTYTPGGGSGILSCPVNNGSVIYGSKETGGHCATGYGFDCIKPGQTGYTGRETAVDVKGSDRMVFLPLLSGNSAEWTIDESGTPINDSEGGGFAVAATASSGGKAYRIRFVHIEATALKVGQKANSATPVGQYLLPSIDRRSFANHVHITIQEEGTYKPADLYFNLCK